MRVSVLIDSEKFSELGNWFFLWVQLTVFEAHNFKFGDGGKYEIVSYLDWIKKFFQIYLTNLFLRGGVYIYIYVFWENFLLNASWITKCVVFSAFRYGRLAEVFCVVSSTDGEKRKEAIDCFCVPIDRKHKESFEEPSPRASGFRRRHNPH